MSSITTNHAPVTTPRIGQSIGQTGKILLAVALFLAAVAGATLTWGLPGLAMSALAMVPVCITALLLITLGK